MRSTSVEGKGTLPRSRVLVQSIEGRKISVRRKDKDGIKKGSAMGQRKALLFTKLMASHNCRPLKSRRIVRSGSTSFVDRPGWLHTQDGVLEFESNRCRDVRNCSTVGTTQQTAALTDFRRVVRMGEFGYQRCCGTRKDKDRGNEQGNLRSRTISTTVC
jgi:hypothetical protein